MQIALQSKQPPEDTDSVNQNIAPDQGNLTLPQQVTDYLQEQVSALEGEKVK